MEIKNKNKNYINFNCQRVWESLPVFLEMSLVLQEYPPTVTSFINLLIKYPIKFICFM
jgi:hypothetical protein